MSTADPVVSVEQPTVFQELIKPVEDFVKEQNQRLPKHRNQKYHYDDFFHLLIYYCVSGSKSLKLLIQTQLNTGLLPAALGLRPVPYSTCQEAFERFSPQLFQEVFRHLLSRFSFKAVPELAALGTLYCMDGSLFPVISSMLWAEYTSKHQALKLHLCFELNRLIPVDFWVGSGNSSEREVLRTVLTAGVTYIGDRGYMSFALCHAVCQAQAHFLFRTKTNLVFNRVDTLPISLPAPAQDLFWQLTDERIAYDNDPSGNHYRLVQFHLGQETYCLLTNRWDLTTFQIILLYAYRWQIELLFRFLKRTMTGIHLIRHDRKGVTIQFYALMITTLLELYLKQQLLDGSSSPVASGPSHLDCPPAPPASADPPLPANPSSRLAGLEFVSWLNQHTKRYWKIGIHWLTALRELLASPFDDRAAGILRQLH